MVRAATTTDISPPLQTYITNIKRSEIAAKLIMQIAYTFFSYVKYSSDVPPFYFVLFHFHRNQIHHHQYLKIQ